MSENIDINIAVIKEEVSINAANNLIQVNINTAPISIINPQNYDLSQFTNTSPNPFVQQSTLGGYVPTSRIININGVAQDLSSDRAWTIPVPSIAGLVPYIGATGNVNLGEFELKAGQLTLDTSPTGTADVGTTRWNDTIGSSETTLKGGSVIIKNGVDLVARVVNKVTPNTTLTKANYPVVRVSGAQGQRLAVAYAQANNDNNSADTLGLVVETIATNQEGFIMTVGQIEGVNTTGSLQGEIWVDGDVLYLSPTTPGRVTNIKPTGLTGHIVVIGYVEYAHANNGKIYVKIMNGWELDELHNVYINPATLANNDILQYDSTDSLWKNKVLATGVTIGSTPISSGVEGRVLFQGSTNVLQQSANLFWDEVNGRAGIGTSTPSQALTIANGNITLTSTGSASINIGTGGYPKLSLNNRTAIQEEGPSQMSIGRGYTSIVFQLSNSEIARFVGGNLLLNTTTDAGYKLDVNGSARVLASHQIYRNGALGSIDLNLYNGQAGWQGGMHYYTGTGGSGQRLTFYSGGVLGTNDRMSIFASGNVGINTTTDDVFKLDVNGTARVQNTFTVTKSGSTNYFTFEPSATGTAPFLQAFFQGATDHRMYFGSGSVAFRSAGTVLKSNIDCGNITAEGTAYLTGAADQSIWLGGSTNNYLRFTDAGNIHIGLIGTADGTSYIQIRTGGATNMSTGTLSTAFFNTGNVGINTTTDAGYKFDVNGTARVQGVITGSVSSGSISLGAASANQVALPIVGYFSGSGAISTSNYNSRSFNTAIGGQSIGLASYYNGNNQAVSSFDSYFLAGGSINITNGTIDLNGFVFGPSITSETNATIKAFSSGLNAASNHYNLYLSGTAQNYIAGNVGIGTSTPSVPLQVQYSGTANLAEIGINVVTNTTSNGMASFGVDGNTGTGHRLLFSHIQNNQNAYIQNYSSTQNSYRDIFFLGSKITFETTASTFASRIQVLTAFSTGNVAINTTTDAGFRLDVNGTARVQGNTTISGNTTITGSFIANSAGTGYEGYKIQDGANARFVAQRIVTNVLGIGHTSTVGTWNDVILGAVQTLSFYTGTSERARIASTGNFLINTTTDAGFRLDVNGTARTGAATIQTLTVGLGAGSQSNNTVLGLGALAANTSGNFNVAIGPAALANNTTATGNVAIGHFAGVNIGTGSNNVAIGREAFATGGGSSASNSNVVIGTSACNAATGSSNVVLGTSAQAGNFSGSVVLGRAATADGNNQFVVGSSTYNAGIIDTATVTPDKRWIVKINGVNYYIALQTV